MLIALLIPLGLAMAVFTVIFIRAAIGGVPAVLVAAFLVKSMSLEMLRWLVIVVVVYAAAMMFRAAWTGRRDSKAGAAIAPVAT